MKPNRCSPKLLLAVLCLAVLLPGPAKAEIMDTTASLAPGHVSLGFEIQAGVRDPVPLELNFGQAIGLARGFDLYLRESIGAVNGRGVRFGAGIKWNLLHASRVHNRPGIALWLGGHGGTGSYDGGGADATLAIDYPFARVRPYLGLDANLEFGGSSSPRSVLGLIAGAQLSVVSHVSWFVEGGFGLLGATRPHFVSTGPRIYF